MYGMSNAANTDRRILVNIASGAYLTKAGAWTADLTKAATYNDPADAAYHAAASRVTAVTTVSTVGEAGAA